MRPLTIECEYPPIGARRETCTTWPELRTRMLAIGAEWCIRTGMPFGVDLVALGWRGREAPG